MSDTPPSNQDLGTLAAKIEHIQKVIDKMEPNMWFVIGAKLFVGAFGVVAVGGILSLVFTLGSVNSDLKNQAEKITEAKTLANDRIAEAKAQESTNVARLERSIDHLRELVERKVLAGLVVKDGEIVSINGQSLVAKNEEGEWKCKLTPKTAITVDGKEAKSVDLKAGMEIKAGIESEQAIFVDAKSRKPRKRVIPPG